MTTNNQLQVEFTVYNALETLRAEVETREKELLKVESDIKTILLEVERIRYLQSLDTFYHQEGNIKYPEKYQQYPELEQRRLDLTRVLGVLKAQLQTVQAQTGDLPAPQKPPAQTAPGADKGKPARKFDDFENFRRNR
jgi:hypothetical protein